MSMSIPSHHIMHWMEPQAFTSERDQDDIFCEFCGEEVPWHNNSCRLLKEAYKIRTAECSWCTEVHKVGDDMHEHTTIKHAAELAKLGIKVSS